MAGDFAGLVDQILTIIQSAIPLVFAITMAYVFWQIFQAWIISGEPQKIESGKKSVIVAIIVLVVMVSLWGIVQVLRSSLGLG